MEHEIVAWLEKHGPVYDGIGVQHDGYWGKEEAEYNLTWAKVFDPAVCDELAFQNLISRREKFGVTKYSARK